jgi:hypothetical protein
MAEDWRVMYNRFSGKGAHSAEWFEVAKNFLKLAFAGDHREAKCPCNRCRNRWMSSEYEMSGHIAKHRSVHLGLSMDGFQPHSNASSLYSSWPVFIMPYNLSPNKCLKHGFVFLALIIPGPKEPMKQMNIFLRPLMEEMKELWQGVDAYDSHLKCRFDMRAAYLWSIHDYLAYGKFDSWGVHDRLKCPICIDDTDAFRLQHRKSLSLIVMKDPFHRITHLGMTHNYFWKAKPLEKGHWIKNSGQTS